MSACNQFLKAVATVSLLLSMLRHDKNVALFLFLQACDSARVISIDTQLAESLQAGLLGDIVNAVLSDKAKDA